jgi:hypothetical protein
MRRALTAAVVTLVTTSALTVAGTPADASTCGPVLTGPSVPNVVLTATGRASVQISVRVQDACATPYGGVYSVDVTAVNPGRDVVGTSLYNSSGNANDSIWTGVLSFDRKSNVGTWSVDVTARSSNEQVTNVGVDTFRLRRNTLLSAHAKPDSVSRGSTIRVSGRLQRLTLGLDYVNWRHQDVRIYFQRAGRTARNWVGTARTGRDGRYHATFTAHRTGRWYAYFPGTTANTSKFSAGHRVVVKR